MESNVKYCIACVMLGNCAYVISGWLQGEEIETRDIFYL